MKKISLICLLLTGFASANAFAKVIIDLKNVDNTAKIFIFPNKTQERIPAIRAGNKAVIFDDELKDYAPGTVFGVGIDTGITVRYCTTTPTQRSQFAITLDPMQNVGVLLEQTKFKCGHYFPVCKQLY